MLNQQCCSISELSVLQGLKLPAFFTSLDCLCSSTVTVLPVIFNLLYCSFEQYDRSANIVFLLLVSKYTEKTPFLMPALRISVVLFPYSDLERALEFINAVATRGRK